jgi:hypothetical protein
MRGFFICIYVFSCILSAMFLVIPRECLGKYRTLELYPKNRDFLQRLQALGKVTTLQNFTEQYPPFKNRLHDTTIQTNTIDIPRNNLIQYNRSTTLNNATLQTNIRRNTKHMAQTTVITLRVSTELQSTIQGMAQKEEIPASYILRRLIKAGLNAEGKHLASQVKATQIPDWE